MPKLTLYRKPALIGFIRSYKIIIDGTEMGSIKNNESKDFDLPAGMHTFQIKTGSIMTDSIEFEFTDNKNFVLDTNKTIYRLVIFFLVLMLIGLNYTLQNLPFQDYLKWLLLVSIYLLVLISFPTIGGKYIFKIKEAD